jgi:hypothetical protein
MTDETKKTMTTKEAIMEIRALQLKHNQEIREIQEKIATNSDETKRISEDVRPGLPNPNFQNQEFCAKKPGVDQEILV